MSELTISVAQLNTYIKNIFDAEELLKNINVVGEITNLKKSGTATYFDLKDEKTPRSLQTSGRIKSAVPPEFRQMPTLKTL